MIKTQITQIRSVKCLETQKSGIPMQVCHFCLTPQSVSESLHS